jgi:hypothetical protein
MLKLLPFIIFWSVLSVQSAQAQPDYLPQSSYKELSTRWNYAGSFDTGLDKTLAVVVCLASTPGAGNVIVIDSTGQIVEMRYEPSGWKRVRQFAVGERVAAACSGAPHQDRIWRLYIGTVSGRVLEYTRGTMGWLRQTIKEVPPPIVNLVASDPGTSSISQLFVFDGTGSVSNLWVSDADDWITRPIPDIDGGATEISFDYDETTLQILVAGPAGTIYKYVQDSTGHWSGGEWASMPAGPLDMAGSADPSLKDMAVFYSGDDGIFRFLFYGYLTDEKARVPIAAGVTHLIGKGPQRRFNEFFGMVAGEFCLFEFNFTSRRWDKIPMKTFDVPVVSTTMDYGRGERLAQVYVACVDGTIHEFTRWIVDRPPEEPEDED